MRLGSIYLITNKTNGLRYVGQTARDVETRFAEHCTARTGHSKLHEAIQKEGWRNFKYEIIEQVPLDKLDEREKFWIKELDVQKEYNEIIKMESAKNFIKVIENDLIFESIEIMVQMFTKITTWAPQYLANKFNEAIKTNGQFLGYHFNQVLLNNPPSDDDVLIDWIKTLNIQYQGSHLYCPELDKEFETAAAAAKYLVDREFYITLSKMPIPGLVTEIDSVIRGKNDFIEGADTIYHFERVPGFTKQLNGQEAPVYCPQLDRTFDSQAEAAQYMVNEGIWTGIKLKTAKLRISDIVRGAFPDYRGYTFQSVK